MSPPLVATVGLRGATSQRHGSSNLDAALDITTPTSSVWLNLVERWLSELATKKLPRGAHPSVRALNAGIRAWVDTWNENRRPHVGKQDL